MSEGDAAASPWEQAALDDTAGTGDAGNAEGTDGTESPAPSLADDLEDWTQEPATAAPPRRPSRSDVSAWIAGPLPTTTSSLDDWLQGPIELHVEREAEDAWSTAGSVTGTWRPPAEHGRSRSSQPDGADGADGATGPPGSAGSAVSADSPGARPEADDARRAGPVFRHELHGLRAVALGLVAIYHIWLGRVSGGVDVFLFLSAFFLTGTFVRRLESGRPLGIPRYWLHTFKRLLPPAAVTILLALAGTAAFLPSSLWPTVMQEAVASAAYVQNALLVFLQVDYHARDAGGASPLQHFWSLSVQGQAFVVWPLIFLLVVRRARRGKSVRGPLIVLVLLIGAASLTWSVISTQTQQQVAYFDTAARMWEFAAGSLLALALPVIDRITGAHRPEEGRPPRLRLARALTGWAGIAALLACGIVLDVSTMFPGWIAIVPLAAAGAVVVAGHSGHRWGVDALLSTRPAAFVGDISYALYLVHWPILVLWLHHSGQQRAGLLDGLTVLAGSVLLAWLVTRAVDPVRRSRWLEARPWRALTAIAASFALVAVASGGWWLVLNRAAESPPTAEQALPTDEVASEAPAVIRPAGWQLGSEWPDLPHSCAGPWAPSDSFPHVACQQLLPGDAEPAGTLVVVGSSHSRQYIPALIPYATQHDLQIVNLSMDGCSFIVGEPRGAYCRGYEDYALSYMDQIDPDAALTTVTEAHPERPETLPAGTEAAVQALLDRGIDVIGTRDAPRWEQDQYQCAETIIEGGGTPVDADEGCGADVEAKLAAENPAAPLADLQPATADGAGDDTADGAADGAADDAGDDTAEVVLLDVTEEICPEGRCSPILGDTYVFMDDNHLTRTFVEGTLVAPMSRELQAHGTATSA
ncbi:acyltransferase family protein [Brachybacterium tyrofermentans]|uniref:acyltransferase family protein n=1 Tax=Brachybacterium tyrofermentans TaxID=47848 RepID=UPI003D1D12CE